MQVSHETSDKLAHYVWLRAQETLQGLTYRAGDFAPASPADAMIFDLALIYGALSTGPAKDARHDAHFEFLCTLAAKLLQGSRPALDGNELRRRASALHRTALHDATTLTALADVAEHTLLRPIGEVGALSAQQRIFRHNLALVLSLEAQIVRSSALQALGVDMDLSSLIDDREQHLYLFCNRYGCLNKVEIGEDVETGLDDADRIPVPNDVIKRLTDIAGACFIILMLAPLFAVAMGALIFAPGPALYCHHRIGRHGRIFRCWKFRTMVPNAENLLEQILATDPAAQAEYAQFYKLRDDPRVTRLGRFLRKTSFDELPQLFNVLVGDMSLVGPRPIAVEERDRWGSYFRIYKRLRPGLTGPWQLYFRSNHPYDEQFEHVVRYAREWSLSKDLRYLFETLAVPFRQRGAY